MASGILRSPNSQRWPRLAGIHCFAWLPWPLTLFRVGALGTDLPSRSVGVVSRCFFGITMGGYRRAYEFFAHLYPLRLPAADDFPGSFL